MKLPFSWLKDYMDINVDPQTYCDAMTMSGSKVEGYETMGGEIENVVLGRILSAVPHPNSDHMFICQVDVGEGEPVQIVTGAPNTVPGLAAVAKVGAKLPGGIHIKKGKLRGELSLGMLCSHDELGFAFEDVPGACADGIIIFPETVQFPLGTDIKEVLGVNETVIEFEITSNRPDCLSVNGLARETAATFGLDFHLPEVSVTGAGGDVNDYAKIEVLEPALCPRYCAKVVKNVKIGPSPKWMKNRLAAAGIRPINNIVDITNYVLLEYNQPMHAFDINYLADHHIIVRRAQEGEKIVTLDEQERQLTTDMLVISDPTKAVAIAGVMGGLNSEITESTTTILFESAMFYGPSVRKTAQRVGLRTEASARYEKGLDANNTYMAVQRACQLVEMLGAGEVVDGVIDVNNAKAEPKTLPFRPDWINSFLGTSITEDFMIDALTRLDFKVENGTITVPTYRADIEGQADIAEEIVRIYGYNKIDATLLSGDTTLGGKTEKQRLRDKVMDVLVGAGYYEVMAYSFTSPKHLAATGEDPEKAIKIMNPLGEETSVMRTNMLSGILEILAGNYNHRNPEAKIFELGTVYLPKQLPLTELPEEKQVLTIGAYGKVDFFDVKGAVEEVLEQIGITDAEFITTADRKAYHPGKTADIAIGGKVIGVMGEVHPDVLEQYEIDVPAYAAELDFNSLAEAATFEHSYETLARFPAVTRDIAVLVDDAVRVAEIEKIIKTRGGKLLESLELFDVYKGKQIAEGKKSVAYAASFRAADRTLTDTDIQKVFNKIVKCLEMELGAQLR